MKIGSAFPSSYLKAANLNGRQVMVTIDRIEVEEIGEDTKPVLYFQGHDKGLALNKTNASSIEEIVGTDETDEWGGHKIVLYPAKTDFQGKRVDCIRVMAPPKTAAKPAQKPTPKPVEEPELAETFAGADDSDVPF